MNTKSHISKAFVAKSALLILSCITYIYLGNQPKQPGILSPLEVEDFLLALSYLILTALGIESLFRLRSNRLYSMVLLGCLLCHGLFHNVQYKVFGYALYKLNSESMITQVALYGNGRFISYNTLDFESTRTSGYYEIDNMVVKLWRYPATDFPKSRTTIPRVSQLSFKGMDFHLGHELLQRID